MTNKQLVIIPGYRDHGKLYELTRSSWERRGFTVHVRFFGWNEDVLPFGVAHVQLLEFLDSLDGTVYLIGVSAGGVAAINALADRPNIHKVVTVSSPLLPLTSVTNKLLRAAMQHAQEALAHMNPETKAKVLSLHGIYDQIVPVKLSKPTGIRTKRIASVRHVPSVVLTMTIYKRYILRFFR